MALNLEFCHGAEDDLSTEQVEDDDVTAADGHDAHGQASPVKMSLADDFSVRHVHDAEQAPVVQVEQMNLEGVGSKDHSHK